MNDCRQQTDNMTALKDAVYACAYFIYCMELGNCDGFSFVGEFQPTLRLIGFQRGKCLTVFSYVLCDCFLDLVESS